MFVYSKFKLFSIYITVLHYYPIPVLFTKYFYIGVESVKEDSQDHGHVACSWCGVICDCKIISVHYTEREAHVQLLTCTTELLRSAVKTVNCSIIYSGGC